MYPVIPLINQVQADLEFLKLDEKVQIIHDDIGNVSLPSDQKRRGFLITKPTVGIIPYTGVSSVDPASATTI